MMLLASALSWVLVSLMPVINAHGSNAGIWERLCSVNGFKLVQVEGEDDVPHNGKHHGKPCPFSHFSSCHQLTLSAADSHTYVKFKGNPDYVLFVQRTKFTSPRVRAPPFITLFS
ncbi:hypothetical protein [Enterovibrio nigricans]|nr:hypothetical protein [Enterovibrio nigricans]PKF49631.1 hypothetical protein AT251_17575 [Enterovibrio nigricans]